MVDEIGALGFCSSAQTVNLKHKLLKLLRNEANMGKAPAFQFYIKDWLSDPELQSASSSSRGIWINALCYMWESQERGKLEGTIESLSRLLNCSCDEFVTFLNESKTFHFDDLVTHDNGKVTLVNRRMNREYKERNLHLKRQDRYRQKKKEIISDAISDADVTIPSSSPTPIIKNNKEFKYDVTPKRWYKNEQGNFVCYQCQKSYMQYQGLQNHLKEHKGT